MCATGPRRHQPLADEDRLGNYACRIRAAPFVEVLAVLYLIFNEGYLASDPEKEAVRGELTAEAIRLTRLVRDLIPADGEAAGLLALMLLTEARRPARVSASGELVALGEQDRSAWDRELIAEGHALVRARLASSQAPGRYQIPAAINAAHTDARDVRHTQWSQVVALYDQLVRLDPSPIVRLNRAIAIAELDGAEVALAEVDSLPLEDYHAFHATHADLLRTADRPVNRTTPATLLPASFARRSRFCFLDQRHRSRGGRLVVEGLGHRNGGVGPTARAGRGTSAFNAGPEPKRGGQRFGRSSEYR